MTGKTIYSDGTLIWHNVLGEVHREKAPAILASDGRSAWCIEGDLARNNNDTLISPNRAQAARIFVPFFNRRSIHRILADSKDELEDSIRDQVEQFRRERKAAQ